MDPIVDELTHLLLTGDLLGPERPWDTRASGYDDPGYTTALTAQALAPADAAAYAAWARDFLALRPVQHTPPLLTQSQLERISYRVYL
jgi:hypothetical protein